jgi:ribonuclease P protein component
VGVGRFPRACRLRRSSDFSAVYERGVRKSSRSFVVFILPNESGESRFGLTTSRKIGRAHERNRIRRRVREILRTARGLLPSGVDVVVNPRKSVGDRAFEELRSELVSLLRGGAE